MTDKSIFDFESLRIFWRNDDLENIKPMNYGEFPEGFDPRKVLRCIHDWIGGGSVTELGCGYGRICSAYPPRQYVGVDINPAAIARAKREFSEYCFDIIEKPDALPGGGLLLAYTVFLHMPDSILVPWINAAQQKYQYILVCEILGRDWRKTAGNVPIFNRELEDYIALLLPFKLMLKIHLPYQRYVNSQFASQVASTDISFLLFGSISNAFPGLAVGKDG